ncbi:MAG: bifunctional molybdenum cofactor biosynthesis protein MoaC/MoaB [Bacteroidota bacterium]|jgi:molybdenum cofactor biosynthesis protein MoaC
MIDITHKANTYRKAIASAQVVCSKKETIEAINNNTVPKGNVLESARVAALFAAKKTSEMIPDCHPLPIEYTQVRFVLKEVTIHIEVEVATIYKTGVEVEAMHAASVAALTLYDMLKPIDKGICIDRIQLQEKQGGKSDIKKKPLPNLTAKVVVCSDSISKGSKTDTAGLSIKNQLEKLGVNVKDYTIIPDEVSDIQQSAMQGVENKVDLIIFTGGTGLSNRDVTPEALIPIIQRRVPGIEEAIRSYGQNRTPYAMLSRSVSGFIENSLVLALPGSSRGASESMDAVFPHILHVFSILGGQRHD